MKGSKVIYHNSKPVMGKVLHPFYTVKNVVIGYEWPPHKGNVIVGRHEIKWYNIWK